MRYLYRLSGRLTLINHSLTLGRRRGGGGCFLASSRRSSMQRVVPGDWRYRVGAGTGWPGVRVL